MFKNIKSYYWVLLITTFTSVTAGAIFYYLFQKWGVEQPKKEAISVTASFMGAIGSVAALALSMFLIREDKIKAIEQVKEFISANKPQLLIKVDHLENGSDQNGSPAKIMSLNITNYSHKASSFTLNYDYVTRQQSNYIITFNYPDEFKSLDNGQSVNIDAYIVLSSERRIPLPEELEFYLSANYLDNQNNNILDKFLIRKNKHGNFECNSINKTIVMRPSGEFLII